MDIMKLVLENEQYLIDQRRYFHRYPEPSGKEVNTVARLDEELTALGIEHVVVENGGLLGFIEGSKPGKTVLLRADVDALPMQESPENLKGPKVAVSENEGVCQACGHDGHTAMLLTAGKILNEHKEEIEGRVILMFERGEEGTGNVVYLYKYIMDHQIAIDSSYGIHLYAMLETGKISLRVGPVMAGALGIRVTIKGRGGHGSRPDQSVSPIDCFTAVYDYLNSFRMKKVSPFNSLTFSLGTLNAGSAGNIIPETLTFSGSCRLFEHEDGVRFKEEFPRALEHICAAYDCTVDSCTLTGPGFAVKNDPECAALAKQVIGEAVGVEHLLDVEPWMASESMSTTLTLWPGVFALVGIANEEKGTGAAHHNGAFDIDEDTLKYGAASAVAYALGFLRSDIDTSDRKWNRPVTALYESAGRAKPLVDVLEGK